MRILNFLLLTIFSLSFYITAQGQDISYRKKSAYHAFLPLGSESARTLNRLEISQRQFLPINTDYAPYNRRFLIFDSSLNCNTDLAYFNSSAANEFQRQYIHREHFMEPYNCLPDSSLNPFKNLFNKEKVWFYNTPAYFLSSTFNDGSYLVANPVIAFTGERDIENDEWITRNTRGVELFGSLNNKIGFYTYFTENQRLLPQRYAQYVNDYDVIPGDGFYKEFKDNGVDFSDARAYVTFNATEYINFQFGRDKNFIGQGKRSLFFSDFSAPHLFLKINTQIGKFTYQNLFTEFINRIGSDYAKKYGAFHYLTFDATENLRFGLFEGVIFFDENSSGRGFDINYLNPVILYRTVDHNLGSPDNVLIGLSATYLPFKNFKLYGQLMFDEFKLNEMRDNPGWWANKYAIQLGFNYIDVLGIKNLDLTAEFNTARPFTYGHDTLGRVYSHFNTPLAHPGGANFNEILLDLYYQATKRLHFNAELMFLRQGLDSMNSNWGGDIFKPYTTRSTQNESYTLNGVESTIIYARFRASYMLKHNLWIDLNGGFRDQQTDLPMSSNSLYGGLGLRLNFWQRDKLF